MESIQWQTCWLTLQSDQQIYANQLGFKTYVLDLTQMPANQLHIESSPLKFHR